MDSSLIERFEAGGRILREAVAGISPDDLIRRIGPGQWSIQELVVHLADTDAIAIDRMKRVIAEDHPPLLYADEAAYVQRLCCHEQSIDDALALFEIGRRQFARVLRKLPPSALARSGEHDRAGIVTLAQLIEMYVGHLDHHLDFLRRKRENL